DYESIEKKGICPTCDRTADPNEFREKIERKKNEREKLVSAIRDCEGKISGVEKIQKLLREYNQAQVHLESLNKQLIKTTEQIGKIRTRIETLRAQVEEANKRLEKAKKELEELSKLSVHLDAIKKELDTAQNDYSKIGKEIMSRQATVKILEEEVSEIEAEIELKEKERRMAEKLKEYQIWLEEFFAPTLDTIEKHVMLSINQEFNQHLQKWWSMLIDDASKELRVDEDFTPIVEQDGYELDINYLSGGEKTSLALAYRLALNSIVQKVSIGMKSNLLILDEPTDGFSKEQLFKVREILNEIKCPQVIMVSHEKELESFADQIFKVEKKDGVSQLKEV
ncbi:MAG: SMC family ATPase, partial [Nitrososphaerota archaeon]